MTSDKRGFRDSDGRGFTVRQFNPETLNVRTIGTISEHDARKARAICKDMAGPDVAKSEEEHSPVREVDDFLLALDRNGVRLTPSAIGRLVALAKSHHKACETQCNTGRDACRNTIERRLAEWSERETSGAITFNLSGDPRGATVKVVLSNGETNDWGKTGYCVPTGDE